jgi:peptidoglycan/xylan/chitin deacetylase (PgdA/CDA1 family)
MSSLGVAKTVSDSPAPIRFLITFDDGPSGAKRNNPTEKVLGVLARNSIQSDIKAIFFIQTRAARGGGTNVGRTLLKREYLEGHLLAFHTSTPHHSNHRFLSTDDFELSLQHGISDLVEVTGTAPQLVRPPFWNFDARTLDGYHRHGLKMLLTDLSANDGVIWGVNWSWHKRSNLLKQLSLTRKDWEEGRIPAVDGATPIVVTFHDINSYTARNVEVYLNILLQVAHELHMPMSEKPFYDDRTELERAALARTVSDPTITFRLPGIWDWLWK